MRLAWFHRDPFMSAIDAVDAVDLAVPLAAAHHVDRFTEPRAHDFVWQHARTPYDVVVYELGDTPSHAFMWAYLFHYPGVLALQARTLERARGDALFKARRTHHLRAERALGGWPLLGAPMSASRLVVVRDEAAARELHASHPEIVIRSVPTGVSPLLLRPAEGPPRFVVVGDRGHVAVRAAERAREAGVAVTVAADRSELRTGDVVIALEWPATGAPPVAALRAMASGLAALVFETEAVAAWPTLDPQTWQTRGYIKGQTPIAVSIDLRDEEHSLMLAMKRLAGDDGLRRQVGEAARRWAAEHASATEAAVAWETVLHEAMRLTPPLAAPDLPRHLTADGTARARALLAEMGVETDIIGGP
jgi:hypothetical protein